MDKVKELRERIQEVRLRRLEVEEENRRAVKAIVVPTLKPVVVVAPTLVPVLNF